jgi:hypothetical protein
VITLVQNEEDHAGSGISVETDGYEARKSQCVAFKESMWQLKDGDPNTPQSSETHSSPTPFDISKGPKKDE